MTDIVRIVRVLEYTGPRDQLEKALSQNAVKGTQEFGAITIREAFLGSYPEVVGRQVKPEIIIGTKARDWDEYIVFASMFPSYWLADSSEEAKQIQEDMTKLGYEVTREGFRLAIPRHKIPTA